jgi:hypothetical protein
MADAEKTALFISSGAAIAAAWALLSSKKVQAEGTDEALMNLLVAIAQNSQAELDVTNQILNRMDGGGAGYPPNSKTLLVGTVQCIVAMNAVNIIPEYVVPDNMHLVLKSHPNNAAGSILYIAESAGNATNIQTAWPLIPNETVRWKVKSTNLIWVASNIVPTLLCYTLEYNG